MTIQSLAWAFDQNVPSNAKLVLLALANRACHRTGRVDFDAEEVSAESGVPTRSLPRYLGALKRNGYLAEEQIKQGDGAKCYWLVFERVSSLPWAWDHPEQADECVEFERASTSSSRLGIPRSFSHEKQA